MSKDKSVMDCVKEFIAATAPAPFTFDEVRKTYSDRPKTQLATALWKLRKQGVVSKDDATGVFTVLTGVNALPTETKPEVKAKPKAKPRAKPKAVAKPTTEDALAKKLHVAERDAKYWAERANDINNSYQKLRLDHEDALAIIRYLENKLYVALQLVAKNGGNS